MLFITGAHIGLRLSHFVFLAGFNHKYMVFVEWCFWGLGERFLFVRIQLHSWDDFDPDLVVGYKLLYLS